ncbi:MAG: hypothetical protein HC880_08520 [Bacteroidia bacterium]|nr:hypothetical protein [Bacteroidia bacterium]
MIKQGSPGTTWQPNSNPTDFSDRTLKHQYSTNTTGEVLLWTYDPNTHAISAKEGGQLAYYNPNTLYVFKTFDEHNHIVIEYKDKEAHVVLKRVQLTANPTTVDDANYASTYYIYDPIGNLVAVLPPEATKI